MQALSWKVLLTLVLLLLLPLCTHLIQLCFGRRLSRELGWQECVAARLHLGLEGCLSQQAHTL